MWLRICMAELEMKCFKDKGVKSRLGEAGRVYTI